MSSQRLTWLHAAMQSLVDEGRLAGIITMIARHGRIADFRTYGHRDVEAGDAMAEDTIFRIYSMSKPITGVALMMLYEEGKFGLSDPVERYIPELANLQVFASSGPDGPELVDADHPMTIRDLMTHTAGLAYGLGDLHPVERLYAERRVLARKGAGLVSTTRDYLRFCQMLLNGGALDGVRILSPTTVDLMRHDHLAEPVPRAVVETLWTHAIPAASVVSRYR